ncbi:MAG: hypothetical protein ACI8QZ_000235 [Chlamydiales bacterium]
MNRPAHAWVLNLEAESELEAGGAFTAPVHLRKIVAQQRRQLLGQLVQPGDVLVTEESVAAAGPDARHLAQGLPGFAWSPTPNAIALLEAAGARPLPAPSASILRAVNARPFAGVVRAPHAPGSFEKHVEGDLDGVLRRLAGTAALGWLVRRSFGAAGRGRRRMESGKPSNAEQQWIEASLRRGPLTIEPWVEITREYTRSGWVAPGGEITISAPCFQTTTDTGAWTRTDLVQRGDVSRDDDRRLAEMTQVAGMALADAGYFGPYGIDAFRHRVSGSSGDVLNPMSEINARFTMDWATALPVQLLDCAANPLPTD